MERVRSIVTAVDHYFSFLRLSTLISTTLRALWSVWRKGAIKFFIKEEVAKFRIKPMGSGLAFYLSKID